MKIKYDKEGDILYILISDQSPVDAIEEPGGIIISYGSDGSPVSLELLNASQKEIVKSGELSFSIQAA